MKTPLVIDKSKISANPAAISLTGKTADITKRNSKIASGRANYELRKYLPKLSGFAK